MCFPIDLLLLSCYGMLGSEFGNRGFFFLLVTPMSSTIVEDIICGTTVLGTLVFLLSQLKFR